VKELRRHPPNHLALGIARARDSNMDSAVRTWPAHAAQKLAAVIAVAIGPSNAVIVGH
jgi:hypothetical protein